MEIVSFARLGYEGEPVKVEADLRRGIPAIEVVGLPDGAVREARERMRAAIRNSGLEFPRDRILINLSPADLKKEGSTFDLAIALAVLGSADSILACDGVRVMVLGELELSGTVRQVRGVLAAVSCGLAHGISRFIVPLANAGEASVYPEARVVGVKTLTEAYHRMHSLAESKDIAANAGADENAKAKISYASAILTRPYSPSWSESGPGFEDIRGQAKLVRALQIAAAGGHNLIVYGPPGCGKTLSILRFPSLLPDLDHETAITATRIHSLAGILHESGADNGLLVRPPFRMPHQSASLEGMTGGGPRYRPGEISLAHGGVLFLDEAAQFRSTVLQSLRGPLETGSVTVSRAGRADSFPSRFQLLLAVNPCPCGNLGSLGRICTCTPEMIDKYWKRMTSPLLDRIDLRIGVCPPTGEELAGAPSFSTEELRKGIAAARRRQWARHLKASPESPGSPESSTSSASSAGALSWLNAALEPEALASQCGLSPETTRIYSQCIEKEGLSGRAGHGILKTARTIADLADSDSIMEEHIHEAAAFRKWDLTVPDFL